MLFWIEYPEKIPINEHSFSNTIKSMVSVKIRGTRNKMDIWTLGYAIEMKINVLVHPHILQTLYKLKQCCGDYHIYVVFLVYSYTCNILFEHLKYTCFTHVY